MTWLEWYAIFVTVIAAVLYYLVWHAKKLMLQLADVPPSEWGQMREILKANLDTKWIVR
jgi:hypothetical protein